jgi:hypothetical protein
MSRIRCVTGALLLSGCSAVAPPLPHFKESPESWDQVPDEGGPDVANDLDTGPASLDGAPDDRSDSESVSLLSDELPYRAAHPAPRVRVDVTKVIGHVRDEDVQRVARSKGYWPIRLCYEEALRRAPHLRGEFELRVTLGHGGAVQEVHRGPSHLDDREVVSCVAKGVRKLSLTPARGGATANLLVSLNPGDEPVTGHGPPPAWPVDPEELRAGLRTELPAVEDCYRQGLRRDPGLAGRIAMRLHVVASGQIREANEVEAHFPDPAVKACILDVFRKATVRTGGKDVVAIYAVRLGSKADADDAGAQ